MNSQLCLAFLAIVFFSNSLVKAIGQPDIVGDVLPEIKRIGQTAYLNCSAINLAPPAEVQWVKVDTSIGVPRLISSDDTVMINTMVNGQEKYDVVKTHMTNKDQFQLVIRSLTEADSGLYMCQIHHPFISQSQWPRKSGYLTVQIPPSIKVQPATITVVKGDDVTLVCEAQGSPTPTVTWKRVDTDPLPDGSMIHQGSTYHISAIVPNGAGQYLCAAVNNVPPSASYIVNVDVQFRPVCVALIDRVRPDPDGMQKTTLTCIVSGHPRPAVTWYKLDQTSSAVTPIHEADTTLHQVGTKYWYTLSLGRRLEYTDYGQYYCIGKNQLGRANARFTVYGAAPITPPLPNTASTDDTSTRPLTTRPIPPSNTCDMYGALRCLGGVTVSTSGPIVQEITNVTAEHLNNLCRSLEDAYHCIGTKLDNCSADVHLLRDVVLSGSRYICNGDSEAFVDSLRCWNKVNAAKEAMTCGIQPFYSKVIQYVTGQNHIFDEKDEFCRLAVDWVSCYMDSVTSVCSSREYNYIFLYMKHTFIPVERTLQCDVLSGRTTISPPLRTTTYATPEPSSQKPMTTPMSNTCDIYGALRCLGGVTVSTSGPIVQEITNVTAEHLHNLCMSLQNAYYCIGTKLDNCSADVHLLRDVVLSGSRYICNGNSEAFVDSLRCWNKVNAADNAMSCDIQPFYAKVIQYVTGQKHIFDEKNEFCRLAVDWVSCYMDSITSVCSPREYNYIFQYIKHTFIPVERTLQCDVLSERTIISPPLCNTSPETSSQRTTTTPKSNTCDIYGALRCLGDVTASTSGPNIQRITNVTADHLHNICTSLQDAYYCIGTKLDDCSADVHLIRDVVLSGSRYICNANSVEFLDSIGCWNKMSAANKIMSCNIQPLYTNIVQYIFGHKHVFDEKDEFCRLAVDWVTCYVNSVSSICSPREHNSIFQYMKHTFSPVESTLQCDILSGVSPQPTPPTGQIAEVISTTSTSTKVTWPASTTSSVWSSLPKTCVYIGNVASQSIQKRLNQWCTKACNRGHCSSAVCSCNKNPTNTKTCHAIGMFQKSSGMSDWCNYQCNYKHYCPRHMCRCDRRF